MLYEKSGSTHKSYIYFDSELIGFTKNNVLYYVQGDHLGRPEVVTTASNSKVWQAKNAAFGRTVTLDSIGGFNVGFPGQYWDDEKDSFYNMFRDYDPSIGRYLQSDPIGLDGFINTYGYVGGNPIMLYDPNGLYGMNDIWAGVYWATNGWSPNQSTVNFSAGLGDSLLFGFGDDLRDLAGVGGVNQCSSAYKYGGYASLGVGGARIAYSGLAKAGSIFAPTAASASNFRNGLKVVFRGGLFPNFRKKTYDALKRAGKTNAQIRASAGRTNFHVNAVGAQAGIGGAIVTGQSNCECSQ